MGDCAELNFKTLAGWQDLFAVGLFHPSIAGTAGASQGRHNHRTEAIEFFKTLRR
jgi:hypothetical protein